VRKFLAYTDPDIVSTALNTLARLRAKNANKDARDLLATNTHAVVRANAARLLGAAEDKEAVDLLIKAATKDADSRVRVSAIRSLGALKDPRAATELEAYQDSLVDRVSVRERKPAAKEVSPPEVSEIFELTTAIGNLRAGSKPTVGNAGSRRYEDARLHLLAAILNAPETSIARAKMDPDFFMPGLLDRVRTTPQPMFKDWRSYSSLAQGLAVVAGLKKDTYGDELEKNQLDGREILRLWLGQKSLPKYAIPDVLTAYAAFKPDDLQETLTEYLQHPDVFVRAAAAGIIADQPKSRGTRALLEKAFVSSLSTDKHDNDAQLALLDAMAKVDAAGSVDTIYKALDSPDYLVRKRALAMLDDPKLLAANPGAANVARDARAREKDKVWPYDPKTGTKLGQRLSSDADYRRALSRKNGSISAVFTTAKGSFTIDLLPEDAPLTVDNFVKLARAGYFNGLEVHRVVPNFVMQDGDPLGNGSGGPGWSIRCEVNMVPYDRGAVGMALSGKDTGGSQWFATHSPQPHLDGGYTVFGKVNETGMKVVDRIVRGDKIVSVRIVGR
jgi:cyclophilin family peptidyl-prolyl cis-trans isomerase/HEAT repeat protein